MAIRVVQLGSLRKRCERMRLGTVRRPPQGVLKKKHAKWDFYNVWLPMQALGDELLRQAHREEISLERFFLR